MNEHGLCTLSWEFGKSGGAYANNIFNKCFLHKAFVLMTINPKTIFTRTTVRLPVYQWGNYKGDKVINWYRIVTNICVYLFLRVAYPNHNLTRWYHQWQPHQCCCLYILWLLPLTHWGRLTNICVGKLIIIDSNNGLSPERRQAIIWTIAGILLIGALGTNFSDIISEIQTFSLKKMRLRMSSAKWRRFCLGLNVLSWPNPTWSVCQVYQNVS